MKLLQAYLDIHSSCNYKCAYCYRGGLETGGSHAGPMPLEVFEKLTPILKRMCWSVSLSCAGEPLLYSHLWDIMDVVNRELAGLDVTLVTNGFLLNERAQDILAESMLSKVSVSIDTVDPELYSRLCGCAPGALDTVLRNVESFGGKLRRGTGWPKLFVTAIAMKSTMPHLADLARRCCGMGVDGIKIQWLVPWNTSLEGEVVAHDDATRAVLHEVASILAAGRVYFEYPNAPAGGKIRSLVQGFRFYRNKPGYCLFSLAKAVNVLLKTPCRLAGTHLNVYRDGTMHACASSNGPGVSFLTDDVDEQEKRLRKAIAVLRRGGSYSECRECRFYQ
jgi:MoaA/NifB/PqqE/SkfB family radical SAM enzyme